MRPWDSVKSGSGRVGAELTRNVISRRRFALPQPPALAAMQDGDDSEARALAEAMESAYYPLQKPYEEARSSAAHPVASVRNTQQQHHAGGRPRTPSQSLHRRNSFDERRIPPTLQEDSSMPYTFHASPSPAASPRAGNGTRSRSGTATSQKLLRRISSDTVHSLDFDSDVGTCRLRCPY